MTATATAIRTILHADLDAFFSSVEQMDRPELRGKPVLVGGSPQQRGVVAACSYEARAYGVHSAMPMRTALSLCPHAILVPPRFQRYRQVSRQVMDIFLSITPLVEPMSVDEAYLDITDVVAAGLMPIEVARTLKQRVKSEVGLTISVGAATSKSVAKIASDLRKPDGLVVVEPGTEHQFLSPLPVRCLPGIGPKAEERLAKEGIATLGDLARQDEVWALRIFGKWEPQLLAMSRGQDHRPVITEHVVKSVSAETTFAQDIQDPGEIAERLSGLSQRVGQRLRNEGVAGKTVTVKIRLADFTTFTRSLTLALPVDDAAAIQDVAMRQVRRELLPGRRFRLLGVGVSNFAEARQLSLFDSIEPPRGY
ncbi:MAG: DNA polymerase IV [Dehalococcoidia bacterium]|nr:DNA polymerase IV [Dehalococcoidia bacterium]